VSRRRFGPADGPLRVLFLCTGNSARSILAEYLLRRIDPSRFTTYSAGTHPRGQVHPLALQVLAERYGVDASAARSKSWQELAGAALDLVITVCDDARESCPLWPGAAAVIHWGMPDPAAVAGTDAERRAAFEEAARVLAERLARLAALPLEEMDPPDVTVQVEACASGSASPRSLEPLGGSREQVGRIAED
jgi:protein-tyrosine-phosphatase